MYVLFRLVLAQQRKRSDRLQPCLALTLTLPKRGECNLRDTLRHSSNSFHTVTQTLKRCRVRDTNESIRAKISPISHYCVLLFEQFTNKVRRTTQLPFQTTSHVGKSIKRTFRLRTAKPRHLIQSRQQPFSAARVFSQHRSHRILGPVQCFCRRGL